MKNFTFIAKCAVCGWQSEQQSIAAATREAKHHQNEHPHRDYDNVPIFE